MYAIQDGAFFYVYNPGFSSEDPYDVIRAPVEIKGDYDMAGAKEARTWFVANHPEIELEDV